MKRRAVRFGRQYLAGHHFTVGIYGKTPVYYKSGPMYYRAYYRLNEDYCIIVPFYYSDDSGRYNNLTADLFEEMILFEETISNKTKTIDIVLPSDDSINCITSIYGKIFQSEGDEDSREATYIIELGYQSPLRRQ